MKAIIVVMLIAKCLMDSYSEKLSIKNIDIFVLISVFLCTIFRITNTTLIYNFVLLLGFVDTTVDDPETNEVYWINILFFMICSVIVSVFPGFFVRSFLISLIPVILSFFTRERFMGMMNCLIILGFGMSKGFTDLVSFVSHLEIISRIRALIYVVRKEEGEEITSVPTIWSFFSLRVVMGNVF